MQTAKQDRTTETTFELGNHRESFGGGGGKRRTTKLYFIQLIPIRL